jgi:phosphatidylserine decarboxylase
MKIHKEGHRIIWISFFIFVGVTTFVNACFPEYRILRLTLFAVLFAVFFLIVRFFRSPCRTLKKDPNAVYAPADGTIVVIKDIEEKKYFNEPKKQISIFMSPLNVHVNFYPITGEVLESEHYEGQKMFAKRDKASDLNERQCTVIEDEKKRKILVKQIAGAMARRIVCYAKKGAAVEQGEELGIIKFGSRVDVLLPVDARVNVTMNQKVTGKETILAYFE